MSIKSDENSELSFEKNTRSSTDGSTRLRHPAVERSKCIVEAGTPALASDPAPEALDSEFITLGLGSSKKPKKKSKTSAKRAVFEED